MSSLLRATLITLALLTTAGCTNKPVLNTQHELPATSQVSEEKMKQVIVAALQKREWTVQRLSPQLVQAEITVRNQYYAATRPMMVMASPASWAKCGLKPASRARLINCAYKPLP